MEFCSLMKDYSDIIHLSRPRSRRPPMPMHDRAAQFAPFAALTGHNAALAEVARMTDKRVSLGDDEQGELDRTIAHLREIIHEQPHIKAVYFVADISKEGGSYVTAEGDVRVIDDLKGLLVFSDNRKIPIPDIISLEITQLKELNGKSLS